MPVINFDEFQDKIKERTKGMRPPKMPDRDVRDRNPGLVILIKES